MIVDPKTLPQEYKEIYDEMIMPVNTNIKLSDVIMTPEMKTKINRFIAEIRQRDKLFEHGLEPYNRLLMYGASGTGKTFSTKAIANTLQFNMLYIDIGRALSQGNVAENVTKIFKLANYIGDCIIFMDECDAVAWNRADANNNDSANMRRATNAIFQGLDQMSPKNIFVSATNLVDNLDVAFRRRFNIEIEFFPPQLDIDESIKFFINDTFEVIDDVSKEERTIIKKRAKNNESMSYFDLENVVKEAMKKAILSGSNRVHTKDIYNDLQDVMHFNLNDGDRITRNDLPKRYRDKWDNVVMPVETNIDFEHVILSDENKEKISQFLKEYEYRNKLIEFDLEPQNRCIFYGASGTGKTLLSKALSNYLNYTMIYVDIAKALSDGNIAQNIADAFELANYIEKAILFFDECDAVVWGRDVGAQSSGMIHRATNSLLQNLDQMNPNCIFIAATNMLHRLDAAFERRIQVKMRFRRPEMDIDDTIKHFIYKKFIIDDDVNPNIRDIVKRRAKQNAKLSYFELEELVKRAMKRAVLNDSNVVHTSLIYKDLQTSMHFKVRYQTALDDEEIFHNNQHYEPHDSEDETVDI